MQDLYIIEALLEHTYIMLKNQRNTKNLISIEIKIKLKISNRHKCAFAFYITMLNFVNVTLMMIVCLSK